jgi:hypothetical protein
MNRLRRAKGRPEAGAYPYQVDLVPPLEGFDDVVEEEIIRFLERRAGTFDVYGQIANGDAFIRYRFARLADAQAFHAQFGPSAEKAVFKKVDR